MAQKQKTVGFRCRQCGKCCRTIDDTYRLQATSEDFARWVEKDRQDILRWVDIITVRDKIVGYDFLIDPLAGLNGKGGCPFLREDPDTHTFSCAIYRDKPAQCNAFPPTREWAISMGCPGYDPD